MLDTHVLIWFLTDYKRIPDINRVIILNPDNKVYISEVCIWEITVKMNIGKLKLGFTLDELYDVLERKMFTLLPISREHFKVHRFLPYLHKCPFDRLLISTAIAEDIHFMSEDSRIHKYDKLKWIW